jgi:hypothetical protein
LHQHQHQQKLDFEDSHTSSLLLDRAGSAADSDERGAQFTAAAADIFPPPTPQYGPSNIVYEYCTAFDANKPE